MLYSSVYQKAVRTTTEESVLFFTQIDLFYLISPEKNIFTLLLVPQMMHILLPLSRRLVLWYNGEKNDHVIKHTVA